MMSLNVNNSKGDKAVLVYNEISKENGETSVNVFLYDHAEVEKAKASNESWDSLNSFEQITFLETQLKQTDDETKTAQAEKRREKNRNRRIRKKMKKHEKIEDAESSEEEDKERYDKKDLINKLVELMDDNEEIRIEKVTE